MSHKPGSTTRNVSHVEVRAATRGGSGSRGDPSSTFLAATNVVKTKKKRNNKRNNKKFRSNQRTAPGAGTGTPLSSDELSDHVSGSYNAGRKGVLGSRAMSRGVFVSAEREEEEQENRSVQAENIKDLNGKPALILNADYRPLSYLPLSLWSWQEAVKAVFSGKVHVVDVYPDTTVRAASLEIPLPSVIALTEYAQQGNPVPAFTRRNVFLRDGYRCQYCGELFHTADLSLDHVVPRSQGGRLNWENAVTCCKACNGRKGSTPLSELHRIGMRLLTAPRAPTQMELAAKAAKMVPRRVHPTWKPYIGLGSSSSSSSLASGGSGEERFIDDRYFEE